MSKLETNTIDNISGSTTLTIGDSNASTISIPKNITLGASGTTVTVPSGATLDLSNATQTGVGGTVKPIFVAEQQTPFSIPDNTYTIIRYETELLDSDGTYNNSTWTWTPGSTGWYHVVATLSFAKAGGLGTDNAIQLYKNNSSAVGTHSFTTNGAQYPGAQVNWIFQNSNVSDYYNIRCYQNSGGSASTDTSSGTPRCVFFGYKMIGV